MCECLKIVAFINYTLYLEKFESVYTANSFVYAHAFLSSED